MRKYLVSDEILNAYKDRYEKMSKNQERVEGDRLFISKVTAVSEQIDNLHVKARVGNYEIEEENYELFIDVVIVLEEN